MVRARAGASCRVASSAARVLVSDTVPRVDHSLKGHPPQGIQACCLGAHTLSLSHTNTALCLWRYHSSSARADAVVGSGYINPVRRRTAATASHQAWLLLVCQIVLRVLPLQVKRYPVGHAAILSSYLIQPSARGRLRCCCHMQQYLEHTGAHWAQGKLLPLTGSCACYWKHRTTMRTPARLAVIPHSILAADLIVGLW